MGAERWLCSSCGATSDPARETPPGCARCDAPLHVGKYGLIELLAPEQSLRVFRGRESSGTKQVTVRILPENLSPSLPALRQAMKKLGSFTHPGIATPLDVGAHRGRAYVVEEFAPGEVTRVDLTLREAMGVMRDVALAIEAAHDHGIVHPDLRAECLRVSRGSGKLGESGLKVALTGFVGPGEGTFRTNLHALGEILYTVATGRLPGPASAASLNPLVNTELEAIIQIAMDTEASHQPPGAGEIALELARWLKGEAPLRTPTRIIPPPAPPQRRSFDWSRIRLEARIAAGVLLALIVVVLVLVLRGGSAPPQQARAPELPPPPPPAQAAEEKPVVVAPPTPAPTPPPPPPPKPVKVVEEKPAPPVEPPKPAPPPVEKPKPAPPPVEPPKPAPPPVEPPKPVPPPVEPPKPAPPPVEPPKPAPPPVETPKPAPPRPIPPLEFKPAPPPPKPKPTSAAPVGVVNAVHADYGIFVKIEGDSKPAAGEELDVLRDGKIVGRLAVERITAPEKRYPQGCAVCRIVSGTPDAGDAVRRIAK